MVPTQYKDQPLSMFWACVSKQIGHFGHLFHTSKLQIHWEKIYDNNKIYASESDPRSYEVPKENPASARLKLMTSARR